MRAFSLVELSIVLVILGLLTGGILSGQSLIRASELRALTVEVTRYQSMAYAFRDKYMALPGDMRNAVKFWGAQAGGTADGLDTACQALGLDNPATGLATCNGNGDGQISWKEGWRAWQHLANAGLVEGTYSGVSGHASSSYGVAGWNIPMARIDSRAGYLLVTITTQPVGGTVFFPGEYGHSIRFGAGEGMDEVVVLHASEAWTIDTKIDDGRPGLGKMRTPPNVHRAYCASTNDPATAEYLLQTPHKQCNFTFITGM